MSDKYRNKDFHVAGLILSPQALKQATPRKCYLATCLYFIPEPVGLTEVKVPLDMSLSFPSYIFLVFSLQIV